MFLIPVAGCMSLGKVVAEKAEFILWKEMEERYHSSFCTSPILSMPIFYWSVREKEKEKNSLYVVVGFVGRKGLEEKACVYGAPRLALWYISPD